MSKQESWSAKVNRKLNKKLHIIDVAAGRKKADLVLKNATYVNVFSGELATGDIAVCQGLVVGMGTDEGFEEVDMTGKLPLALSAALRTLHELHIIELATWQDGEKIMLYFVDGDPINDFTHITVKEA